ncbi:glycosyltransferase family 2 protein [Luteimonas aestuarii]|uniref:Glycosyltransferase family 2 protein n=1 Tax=Luteimonas aestuarii TaxID=453837 RepID=A0A4R5TKK1_9GAMM|nr:glycosyltransferase family 2 protein [Luteimonas aestuarii]TDK20485.1 glycosyltransferase family 2 protein [Luteimonas aestuarii]
MRVAVALCTYNGARFLQAQLDSLAAQRRRPDALVVGDDGSTDGTLEILERFAGESGTGIRVDIRRNSRNLGFAANFDATLRRSDGDVVFLCDQDDVWHPDKIARMCGEFERRPRLGLLHTDARLVDVDGQDMGCGLFEALEMTAAEIAAEHAGRAFDVLLRRNTVTGATAAIRREALHEALPVAEGWVHDEWLALRTSLGWEVDCLPWASIDYRQHGANQIGMRRRTLREKLAGIDRPKRVFMQDVADRLTLFLQRCDDAGLPLPQDRRDEILARIGHARYRAGLPTTLASRLRAVLAESRAGGYHRFSSGWRSIASDVVDLK